MSTTSQTALVEGERMLEAGRLTYAAERFRRALAPLDETPTAEQIAASLVGLGRVCYLRGDVSRARSYAEEALHHDGSCLAAKVLIVDLSSPTSVQRAGNAWRREAGMTSPIEPGSA